MCDKVQYLGMTLTNQNLVHDETDSSSNSGNTYHISVQNLISSCVLSKNINIKIYKNIFCMLLYTGMKLGISH